METVNWKTDFEHAGSFETESTEIPDKIREAWADHAGNFPTCTLCDLIEVDEDFI